ncbi:MAG: hypothetical protein ACON5H_00945 [Akkermansiaceae bacterium]
MKTTLFKIVAVCLAGLLGASCTTTYDAQGRAVETITPQGAALGAAAVGLIGYSIAKNRHKEDKYHDRRSHRNHRNYDRGYHHRGGYCPTGY